MTCNGPFKQLHKLRVFLLDEGQADPDDKELSPINQVRCSIGVGEMLRMSDEDTCVNGWKFVLDCTGVGPRHLTRMPMDFHRKMSKVFQVQIDLNIFMKKLPETVAKESPPIMCGAVLCNLSGFRPIISCFRYGSHAWMDYFNYCLTSDLYNRSQYCCIPVSGDYYLSYHRAYLKFNDASAHCIVGFALL